MREGSEVYPSSDWTCDSMIELFDQALGGLRDLLGDGLLADGVEGTLRAARQMCEQQRAAGRRSTLGLSVVYPWQMAMGLEEIRRTKT